MNIILRTVCGCERIVAIPYREDKPPCDWNVAYVRGPNYWSVGENQEWPMSECPYEKRRFEWTTLRGQYGYPVYLEVL